MTFLTVYITYSVLCNFTEILTGTGTPILWGAIMGTTRSSNIKDRGGLFQFKYALKSSRVILVIAYTHEQ